ncbi:hypothetical protein [Pontimicrobium aquaticum]|uniref:Uncharacterized protein n=1 Tax=Pontimicrobium aquaticum TaxID=2565367 RepID=A0A4U0F4K3_9FLAO|nr:hypothetical protein [Pontimicrobium aquaticum]TJY37722.1 hypothetical protein E5167_00260 [Pontimicrobium aquaticum]
MRQFLFVFFFLNSLIGFSQEEWVHINTRFGANSSEIKDAIPVVDTSNGNFAFFLQEYNGITGYLYNENQELISEMRVPLFPKKTPYFIGSVINDYLVTLFFKNGSGRKFSSIAFNFTTNKFVVKEELPIDLRKEVIVDSFNEMEILHLLTIIQGTSVLKLYTFDKESNIETKTIDLTEHEFSGIKGGEFYYMYFGPNGYGKTSQILKNEPMSLELTSSSSKAYFNEGVVTLTTDFQDDYTYLLNIDTKDGSWKVKELENKDFTKTELRSKSNSFIYKDLFFKVHVTPYRLVFSIYNKTTNELVKEFTINEDSEIDFKNSPIMLEGGDLSNYRELKRTKQFLRKIFRSNLGVSVYEREGLYVVTIGASEEIQRVNMSIMGGMIGGMIGGALFSAFNSYSKTKSTRIICLFDKDFSHVEGDNIPLNGFDIINNDSSNLEGNQLFESVFKYKDSYIRGAFNKKSGVYRFLKYTEY